MTKTFYDNLAKNLGGYGFANDNLQYRSEYPSGDPEKQFYEAVVQSATGVKRALDIGCGDGIFSFRVMDKFARIDGIDNSKELIKIANEKQKELEAKNIVFTFGDASRMPYQNESFNVAFNRRGPSFYKEFARVLKPGGIYIEIGIGEQDSRDLKEIFGRGQDFGKWNRRRIDRDKPFFKASGFMAIQIEDYFYDEFYPSREMLVNFLQGVPIFEDFDRKKDAERLNEYYKEFETENGEIQLKRHRVLYILHKTL